MVQIGLDVARSEGTRGLRQRSASKETQNTYPKNLSAIVGSSRRYHGGTNATGTIDTTAAA
jgi:hypothetical protein